MHNTKLTATVAAAIIEAVSQGVPLETALVAAKLNRHAMYELIQRAHDPNESITPERRAFGLQVEKDLAAARATWEATLIRDIQQTALDPSHKDSFQSKKFLLTHHPTTRTTYYEHRGAAPELVNESDHQRALRMKVTELSTAEIESLLALPDGSDPHEIHLTSDA